MDRTAHAHVSQICQEADRGEQCARELTVVNISTMQPSITIKINHSIIVVAALTVSSMPSVGLSLSAMSHAIVCFQYNCKKSKAIYILKKTKSSIRQTQANNAHLRHFGVGASDNAASTWLCAREARTRGIVAT
jgi:hypothetical protein